MNILPLQKRVQIIEMLIEGNCLRTISNMADVSRTTILKLLLDTGQACQRFHNDTIKNINAKRVCCNEIYSFANCKEDTKMDGAFGNGDIWTWVALDTDSKLVVSWLVGERDANTASSFMYDVRNRLGNNVQLTVGDDSKVYMGSVETSLGYDISYDTFVKMYGGSKRGRKNNALNRKVENHCYAIALHFVYYNFSQIHHSLKATPAMKADVIKKPMTIEDIVKLVPEPPIGKRGQYNTKGKLKQGL